jgi:hypothetical protein
MWKPYHSYLKILHRTDWTPENGLDCSDCGVSHVDPILKIPSLTVPTPDELAVIASTISLLHTAPQPVVPSDRSAWLLHAIVINLDSTVDYNTLIGCIGEWTNVMVSANNASRQKAVSDAHVELQMYKAQLSTEKAERSRLRIARALQLASHLTFVETFKPTRDWGMVGFTKEDMDAAKERYHVADRAVHSIESDVAETETTIGHIIGILDIIKTVPCGNEVIRGLPSEIIAEIFKHLYADPKEFAAVGCVCTAWDHVARRFGFVNRRQLAWARSIKPSISQTIWQRTSGALNALPKSYVAAFGPTGPIVVNTDRGTAYRYTFDPDGGLGVIPSLKPLGIKAILKKSNADHAVDSFKVIGVIYIPSMPTVDGEPTVESVAIVLNTCVVMVKYSNLGYLGVSDITDESIRLKSAVIHSSLPATLILQSETGAFYSYDASRMGAGLVAVDRADQSESTLARRKIIAMARNSDAVLLPGLSMLVRIPEWVERIFIHTTPQDGKRSELLATIGYDSTPKNVFQCCSYYRGTLYVMMTNVIMTYRATTDEDDSIILD